MNTRVILGLDPGYDRLGWSIASPAGRSITVRALGCIQTTKKLLLYHRYQQLCQQLSAMIDEHQPTEVAIETIYFSKNTTTALPVSEARGLIIGELIRRNLPIFDYNPTQIKMAVTGSGRADKTAIAKMLKMQVALPTTPQLDDALDAVGICLTHTLLHTSG